MMTALETARAAFSTVASLASCKIGLEANISPADYPLVRIVPSRVTPGRPYGGRTVECLVYFGAHTTQAEGGLEAVYASLFDLEDQLLQKLRQLQGRYLETVTDEDRLDHGFKLMAIRCELLG